MNTVTSWALVPARGGSKSIPHKNIVLLNNIPLLHYGVRAAQASPAVDHIICSTEDNEIARVAAALDIAIDQRPQNLADDDSPVIDMARELLPRYCQQHQCAMPDIIVLLQPTSPFVLPVHIASVITALTDNIQAQSAQTIVKIPHNHHAYNQRVCDDRGVRFKFAEQRAEAYNKQRKPELYAFGNVVAVRTTALLSIDEDFFPQPSMPIEIERPYDLDLDDSDDWLTAEALLTSGKLVLSHIPIEEGSVHD